MTHDVFVSHSVKDKAVAEKIVARLEAESVRCWVAPRDVVPGADWGESIIDAIESSRIMVLIFSQNANGSTQIKREVERAVDKNVYTIPFRVEDIEPTRSLEYFISTSQWMDAFTPPLEQHLDKLARTVKAILARPAVGAADVSKPPEPIRRDETPVQAARDSAPHSPAWLKPVAIVAGVLILGAVVWFSLNQKRAGLGKEKNKSAVVADPSLLALSPAAVGTPQNSNSAANPAEDATNASEVFNQPAKVRPQLPTKMMNQLAEPVGTPNETELAAPSFQKNSLNPASKISPLNGYANKSATRAEEPSAVVQRYYDSINRRDLTQAYDCLSQGFKAHSPMNKFAQIFASTQSIEVRQLQENSRDDAKAVVTVSFVEVDAENRSREWERRVALVKEGDAWRINGTQSIPGELSPKNSKK